MATLFTELGIVKDTALSAKHKNYFLRCEDTTK